MKGALHIIKTIELEFKGYLIDETKNGIKAVSGVYCVYSCVYNKDEGKVSINKLLYIGESENVRERIVYHDRLDDWNDSLKAGQILCYSYAEVGKIDRERAEAALIFEMQPTFNTEHTKEFIYNDTEIITSGANKFLPEMFAVKKGMKK